MVVTAGDTELARLEGAACGADEFLTLNWLGFVSTADADCVWHLDNVSVTDDSYGG